MGATEWAIVTIISKDFMLLFAIAFICALPTSVYLMHQWLNGFANRTQISPALLIAVILSVGTISLLTIFFKTKKAASANPVESLRYE
jgi:putative ABC transport system permease protein